MTDQLEALAHERLSARVGITSILLFGVCVGIAGTLIALGHRSEASWVGLPMMALIASLIWSTQVMSARESGQ